MKSLKKRVQVILVSFLILIVFAILINNFFIKNVFDLWRNVDENSKQIVTKYIDGDFNIRVINNSLLQLNTSKSIDENRKESILEIYNRNYKKLEENLNELYTLNNNNINILSKIDGYYLYNMVFKREDIKDDFKKMDKELKILKIESEEISKEAYEDQYVLFQTFYDSYEGLENKINNINENLDLINKNTTNNLIDVFNFTICGLILFIIAAIYFMDRIIRKDANYMLESLRMLNENNYDLSKLPKLKAKFDEEKALQQNIEEIFLERQFIREIKDILNESYILDEVIEKLLYLVKDRMNTNRIGVAYIDYKKGKIVAEHGAADYDKILLGPGFSVPIEETSLKNIIKTKKGIINNNIKSELKKRPKSSSLKLVDKEGVKSNMIIPLILDDEVFGYLFFSSLNIGNYSEKTLELGMKIAEEISGILNTTYFTKKVFISMTSAFANLVEKKDNDTGDHILRMTKYSKAIAEGLITCKDPDYKVSQSFVNDISNYAPVHDIGKVGIPDSILKKPGKLTPEEREIMETHANIGGDIMREVEDSLQIFNRDFFKVAMEIAKGHHEKWDGSGYPRGLSGKDIPLEARIIALADVFDALSSKRVYKDDFGFENSVDIINKESGKHFDPKLVEVFNGSLGKIRKIYEENKAK